MIGVAAGALIVIGIILGFFTVFGFIIAVVGLVMLVAYLVGFGRRAAERGP